MDTKVDNKQFGKFNNYRTYQNDPANNTQDLENGATTEIPWKQLSLGGAFGLLIGGGSIIAANSLKGSEEEALLAGAEAGGDVEVVGEETDDANAAETASNDNATASTTDVNIHVTPAHHHTHHVNYIHHQVDVYHEVNVLDMDDSLSFAQAFAQARAELGAGGAFEWRGGVFGTYHASEWNSMSHAEQANFTATAMNTYSHALHDNYNLAQTSVTHHFTEGDVIDLDTGLAFHDEPYYIENIEIQTVEAGDTADLAFVDYDIQVEGGDTGDYLFANNDVEVKVEAGDTSDLYYADNDFVTGSGDTADILDNDVQIIDTFAEVQSGVQELIEVNEAVGDFLDNVSNTIDDASAAVDSLNEVASLINDTQDYSAPESTDSYSYEPDPVMDSAPEPEPMPDYVSDGDTADIL